MQYSTVIIIYDNTLHPLFTPDPCDYSRGLPVFKEKIRAHLDLLSIPWLWGGKCQNV